MASVDQPPAPVFVAANQAVERWLKPLEGKPGAFRTQNVGLDKDINFVPFYQLPRHKYAIYWDMFTPQEWQQKTQARAREQERQKRLEAVTVSFVQPGQIQTERDFNLQGEDTSPAIVQQHYGRRGSKWFSFDVPVDSAHAMTLVVSYTNDEQQMRTFNILVDGRKVGEQTMERRSPEKDVKFYEVEYPLPAEFVKERQKVTVRFEATNGNGIGAILGLRMIRTDVAR